MSQNLIFLIESGPVLDLCRQIIANRVDVEKASRAYVRAYGGDSYRASGFNGRVFSVHFKGERHPDFRKPGSDGCCEPRKKTEAAADMAALPEYINEAKAIVELLMVPVFISYKTEGGEGWTMIGNPMHECGFLWLDSEKGPFGMWVPDIAAHVAAKEADGCVVQEPAKSFKPEFEGCRQIHKEEWDILVAQHRLAKKLATSDAVEAA